MAITFTESEWLILSSLGYATKNGEGKNYDSETGNLRKGCEKTKLSELLDRLEKEAKSGDKGLDKSIDSFKSKDLLDNYLGAIKSLKKKLNNFVISKFVNHNKENQSGFVALAIEPVPNNDKDVIICCRGSDSMGNITDYFDVNEINGKNRNDWINANLALLGNEMTDQQFEMKKFMNDIKEYDNIYLTGHSLGGNLAMYGAIVYEEPKKIRHVYSFDGPGFNEKFIRIYADKIKAVENKISNFQNEYDIVSSALISVGKIEIIESSLKNGAKGLGHLRWGFSTNKDGTLTRNNDGNKADYCNVVHDATMRAAKKYNVGISGKNHDLTGEKCIELLNLIASFSSNTFSDLDRWKSYSGHSWFLKSAIGDMMNSIDAYYDSIERLNRSCERRIKKVFSKIVIADNKHASLMEDTLESIQKMNSDINSKLITRVCKK